MTKVLPTKLHQNLTTKSRVIHVGISIPKQHEMIMPPVPRVKFIKTMVIFRCHTKGVSDQVSSNSVNKIKSVLQNGAIRGLQIGADFRDYKSGQEVLQIGAVLAISSQGEKIANRSKAISNWSRD